MNICYNDLIMSRTGISLAIFLSAFSFFRCQKEEEIVTPILLEAEIQHVTEFGGSNGSIDVTISGGLEPYALLWSTGDTTKSLSGIPAGTYILSVTDEAEQSVADTFVVNQPGQEVVKDVDGNIYNTVKIGNQTWMQENLHVTHAPDGSEITGYAYINNPESIKKYGLLYTWDVSMNGSKNEGAQGICPVGWHIPSDDEWKQLEMALGMTSAEADMANTWRGSPAGTMLIAGGSSGYNAQLGGRRSSGGAFSLKGRMEYVWTSTESGNSLAWRRCLDIYSSEVGRWDTFPKSYGFSIRCVKDD